MPEASTYVGAPRYLAPELLQQDFFPGVIAPPLDIWALGCCVYYLASGKEICLREDGSFPKPLEEMLLAIPARFGTPLKNIIRATQITAGGQKALYVKQKKKEFLR